MQTIPIRTAEEAAAVYHRVLAEIRTRFTPDDVPDFRVGVDRIRSIVVPGHFGATDQRQTWLKIILNPHSFDEPDLMRRFNWNASGIVRAPRIRLRGETTDGYPFLISDNAGHNRIIQGQQYAGDPMTSWKGKHEISELFWAITATYLSHKALPKRGPAPEIWFDDQIVAWLRRGEENGSIARRILSPTTLLSAIDVLRFASERIPAPGTIFSQARFRNAEVRRSEHGYILIDWGAASFVPLMYDAAFWVYDATLHSWNIAADRWIREVLDYEDAFCEHTRTILGRSVDTQELRFAFRTSLLERMLKALLVDSMDGDIAAQPLIHRRAVAINLRSVLKLLLRRTSALPTKHA